jgi:hypothetical protein
MRTFLFSMLTIGAIAATTIGCGGTYECCFNDLYYSCSNQTTLDSCAMGHVDQCTRDAEKDTTCKR